jgi:hypothetical protein
MEKLSTSEREVEAGDWEPSGKGREDSLFEREDLTRQQRAAEALELMRARQQPHDEGSGERIQYTRREDRPLGSDNGRESRRPKVLPDQFTGKTSWGEYISHFKICAELNAWDEQERIQYFCYSMRGAASQFLGTIPEYQQRSFRRLMEAFSRRFNPNSQSELYRVQLRNRTRNTNESLPELGQDIRRLVQLAYPEAPPALVEMLGKDHFIDAIEDQDMRWRMYQAKVRDLDEAIGIAVEVEAYKNAEKQRCQPKKLLREVQAHKGAEASSSSKGLERQILELKKQMEEMQQLMKGNFKKKVCYGCGEEGHFIRECRKSGNFFAPRRPNQASN